MARIGAMLLLGMLLFAVDSDFKSHPQYIVAALVAALAFVPFVSRHLSPSLDLHRSPSPRLNWIMAAVLFVLSARYFLLSASLAGRDLFPKFHDEHMYLLQARMLAHGRLWMPRHPLGEFFESFNVIVKPVYAATYFPGTALFYVPGIWLNAAPWSTSVLIAGLAVAMLYLVMTEMLDGVAGLLAALLAMSLQQLRGISVMTMSHPVMLLLFLLTLWGYLRWRRNHSIGWAALMGITAGWAAITRPLDALCLIAPLGVAMFWEARKLPTRCHLILMGIVVLGALPFLSLQLAFNKGTTGSFLHTPFGEYAKANFPGLNFGWSAKTPAAESPSPLPQVRDYYQQFLRDDFAKHGREGFLHTWIGRRLEPAADAALPGHLLFILLPIGLLGLGKTMRWAVAAGALLLPLAYTFYPSYLKHYGLVTAPAFILLSLLGIRVLCQKLPSLGLALPIAMAAMAIGSLPEFHGTDDPYMHAPYLADINAKLAQLDHTPAVVLFHYDSGKTDVHEEPVYNLDTPWPDDAPIIRAQDLGPENHKIFSYYARLQPRRFFYRYDRTTAELTPLGWR